MSTENIVSIQQLKSSYNLPHQIDEYVYIRGIVTANDRNGNRPYTIVLQDPTGSIEVKVSGDQLFVNYPVRYEILLSCYMLVLADYLGTKSLGALSNPPYNNTFISKDSRSTTFKAVTAKEERPVPEPVYIGNIKDRDVSKYVCIENTQFLETGVLWCDTDKDGNAIATNRHLVNNVGDRLTVRINPTSHHALHKLPHGNGYIEGILGIFAGEYQLTVPDSRFVVMNGPRV